MSTSDKGEEIDGFCSGGYWTEANGEVVCGHGLVGPHFLPADPSAAAGVADPSGVAGAAFDAVSRLRERIVSLCDAGRINRFPGDMVAEFEQAVAARVRGELPAEEECPRTQIAATASDVYCEITDGVLSYPTYDARTILAHANDATQKLIDEESARVRAEERQRTLLEAADALHSDDGPGNLLSTATWLRERAALVAGSAVPVATPEPTEVELLARHAAYISRTITASYPDGMDPELVMRRRVGKIFVEAGELGDAIEGWTGENPRKGVYATREDVIKELIDCASASLCAIEHLTGDAGLSVGMVAQQVIGNAQRLSESIPDQCGPVSTPTEPACRRAVELVGLGEAADLLRVSKQRAQQLSAKADFPAPLARLAATPVWYRRDVEAYAAGRRTTPGPVLPAEQDGQR